MSGRVPCGVNRRCVPAAVAGQASEVAGRRVRHLPGTPRREEMAPAGPVFILFTVPAAWHGGYLYTVRFPVLIRLMMGWGHCAVHGILIYCGAVFGAGQTPTV